MPKPSSPSGSLPPALPGASRLQLALRARPARRARGVPRPHQQHGARRGDDGRALPEPQGDWYDTHPPGKERPKERKELKGPRDLFNSVTRDWSWPCVLVFFDEWVERAAWKKGKAGRGLEPDQFIPRSLYLPDGPNAGKTLLDLCTEDPANVDPAVWQDYYARVDDTSKGILPFRIGLIYEEMVAAVAAKDLDRFVCAAGILSHYVGDACQPLHISCMFNGEELPGGAKRGEGVHSAYEAKMLNANAAALVAGIDAGLAAAAPLPNVTGAREATLAGVDLMKKTFANLSPKAIVDAFAAGEDLWDQFGDATIATCVEGARTLAMLWESAWAEGNGAAIATSKLTARHKDDLVTLYSNKDFIPSVTLKELVEGT